MSHGLISESDIQQATERLRHVLPEQFCRAFFGKERLGRLERMVGTAKSPAHISHHFRLDLLVRQQGPQLLAERPRRIGTQETSVRRVLLQSLPEAELRSLFVRVRRSEPPALRRRIERRSTRS